MFSTLFFRIKSEVSFLAIPMSDNKHIRVRKRAFDFILIKEFYFFDKFHIDGWSKFSRLNRVRKIKIIIWTRNRDTKLKKKSKKHEKIGKRKRKKRLKIKRLPQHHWRYKCYLTRIGEPPVSKNWNFDQVYDDKQQTLCCERQSFEILA